MKSKLDAIKAANPLLEIQFNLRDISHVNPDVPKVFPTGKYDIRKQSVFFRKKIILQKQETLTLRHGIL